MTGIIIAGIGLIGSVVVGFFGYRVNHTRNLVDGFAKRVEQLEVQVEKLEQRASKDTRYIEALVDHIYAGKPPPPPPRPDK